MARASKVLTLDVGTSTIKLAEFLIGPNGALTLNKYAVTELGLDPNKDDDRGPVVAAAVASLFQRLGLKPQNGIVSLPGHSLHWKFVKLPPVDAAQLEQMIGFEAQQSIPFPLHVVVWDYQIMPHRGASGEVEAVIVAMKTDLLEKEVASIEAGGLRPRLVDVAPLALYNAYRYNYDSLDGTTLLIDMGARTTNLLFIEKNGAGQHTLWIRNTPIAGNTISQNICNELQEPFAASETLKKGKGYVSLGGAYADPEDQEAARISKLIRSNMTRLHTEINRSITFYRTSNSGTAPKRILLTGGTSQLPYIDVFLAEKLNVPVEYFHPLQNVAVSPEVDRGLLEMHTPFLGEVVGLATRDTGQTPIEVALLPPALKERLGKRRKQPYLFMALAAFTVLAALPSLWNWQMIPPYRKVVEELQTQIETDTRINNGIKQELPKQGVLKDELAAADKLKKQRGIWLDILSDLNAKIPAGVWITSVSPRYVGANNVAMFVDKEVAAPAASPGPGGKQGNGPGGGGSGGGPTKMLHSAPAITHIFINGLYHANAKTKLGTAGTLNQYIIDLAPLAEFDIDKEHPERTLKSVITQAQNGELALEFSAEIKLKKPIDLTP